MKIVALLLIASAYTRVASSQQQSDALPTDSSETNRVILIDPGIALGKPTLLLPPMTEGNITYGSPFVFFPTRSLGSPPPFLRGMMEQKVDLTSPLRLQMEREERLRPLWTVLGTVQVGGVAYLAYRHIKKYGFLK